SRGYCPPGDELEERQFITDPRFHPVGVMNWGGAEFISEEESMPTARGGEEAPSLALRVSLQARRADRKKAQAEGLGWPANSAKALKGRGTSIFCAERITSPLQGWGASASFHPGLRRRSAPLAWAFVSPPLRG